MPSRSSERLVPAHSPVRWRQPSPCRIPHLLGRHRVDSLLKRGEESWTGDRLEVPKLVRDVRDAIVVEHQPRTKLMLRPCDFCALHAARAHALDLFKSRIFDDARGNTVDGG